MGGGQRLDGRVLLLREVRERIRQIVRTRREGPPCQLAGHLRDGRRVEPLGDWGQGSIQLLEIPSDAEINDNVLAYWRPRAPMAAGSEVSFAYRQYWGWAPPERPPLALAAMTRVGRGSAGRRRRFSVDFAGEMLGDNQAGDLKPMLTVAPGAVQNLRVWPYPERKVARVSFELDPGNENACEMRLILEMGGKPVSETWLYRWTP